ASLLAWQRRRRGIQKGRPAILALSSIITTNARRLFERSTDGGIGGVVTSFRHTGCQRPGANAWRPCVRARCAWIPSGAARETPWGSSPATGPGATSSGAWPRDS
ncbi:unnamed protein product, partial [Ixodes pacificus]